MEANRQQKEAAATGLGWLLDAADDAVVTLTAGETRLLAHRAVLADRSPVFEAMFQHGMAEASSGAVDIPDVEGPVLRHLLAYLYHLQVPQLPDVAPQLLVVADKYGVSALKEACEQQVLAQLSVETAAAAAVLAIRHSCDRLREAAVHFIRAHTHQVMATKGYADAVRTQPEDVVEMGRLLSEASAPPPAASGTCPPPGAGSQDPASASASSSTSASTSASASASTATAASASSSASASAPPPDDATVSRLRQLSAEEKGRRLMEAARDGAVGELEALLAAGADVAARDSGSWNCTALHWAAVKGREEAARRLLAARAAVDARNSEQWTPLHYAARYGHAAVVRLLLARNADHSARERDGWTPLHLAARDGHAAVVRLLLARNADHSARKGNGWTPLHLAARNGHTEAAAVLLEAGADRAARDNEGKTPLDRARELNRQQVAALLETS